MKLTRLISRLIFIIAIFSTFLAFGISFAIQYNSFEKDKEHIKKEFFETKKEELKKEVLRVYKFIEHQEKLLDKKEESQYLGLVTQSEEKFSSLYSKTLMVQDEILDWIGSIRFDNNGYIFVNTIDKKALVFDGKKLEVPKTYKNDKVFSQQLEQIKNPNGGFFTYKFKKLNTAQEFDKMGFVIEFKKWGWIIGAGIYLDEINDEIKRKEEIFKDNVISQFKFIILFFFLVSTIIYFASERISRFINQNINNLIMEFKNATENNKKIETNKLTYNEFISLGKNLNLALENKIKAEEKLQDYINIVNEHVLITSTDEKGIIKEASIAFCRVSGYSREELIGQRHSILKHPDTPKETYIDMWDSLKDGRVWKGELKNKTKGGEPYWVEIIIQPELQNGKIVGYTAIKNDITNKKAVEYLSITDELTQLYNRRYFNKIIEEELNRTKRNNSYISFMMIDIDYFKRYNDNYGHQAGDLALQKVATALKSHARRGGDFLFRLGGEEFAMIFSNEDEDKAYEFANLMRKEVENLRIPNIKSNVNPYITISIGITTKRANNFATSADLYKLADEAVYFAKNSGRNTVYVNN